jgi:hypothetical protein
LEISEDFGAVRFSEFAPVAGGEGWGEMELTDGYSEEAESWEADSGGHFADLAVAAFVESEFEPAGGDVVTLADGRVAGRKLKVYALGSSREGHLAFDDDTLAQFLQRFFGHLALDLRPISAGMGVFWIEKFGV